MTAGRGGNAARPRKAVRPSEDAQAVLEHFRAWAAFILANLLWVFVSLPLVTLPAATAGLVAVMSEWVEKSRPEPLRVFFWGVRARGSRATLLVLMQLLVAAPLLANVLITLGKTDPFMIMARALTLAVLVVLAAVNVYLWPLLVRLELSPLALWRTAFKLFFLHPWPALLSLGACGLIVGISLILPKAVALLFSVSALAFCACYGASRIVPRYFKREPYPHG